MGLSCLFLWSNFWMCEVKDYMLNYIFVTSLYKFLGIVKKTDSPFLWKHLYQYDRILVENCRTGGCMERNIHVIKDADGNSIVMINDIRFKGKRSINWDDVKVYLKNYVGDVYQIVDTEDVPV